MEFVGQHMNRPPVQTGRGICLAVLFGACFSQGIKTGESVSSTSFNNTKIKSGFYSVFMSKLNFQYSRNFLKVLKYIMRFQVLMVVSMKMTVFWDVAPYNLLKVY
jgi:hypothetical protein